MRSCWMLFTKQIIVGYRWLYCFTKLMLMQDVILELSKRKKKCLTLEYHSNSSWVAISPITQNLIFKVRYKVSWHLSDLGIIFNMLIPGPCSTPNQNPWGCNPKISSSAKFWGDFSVHSFMFENHCSRSSQNQIINKWQEGEIDFLSWEILSEPRYSEIN